MKPRAESFSKDRLAGLSIQRSCCIRVSVTVCVPPHMCVCVCCLCQHHSFLLLVLVCPSVHPFVHAVRDMKKVSHPRPKSSNKKMNKQDGHSYIEQNHHDNQNGAGALLREREKETEREGEREHINAGSHDTHKLILHPPHICIYTQESMIRMRYWDG